jgi:hypothetical protein
MSMVLVLFSYKPTPSLNSIPFYFRKRVGGACGYNGISAKLRHVPQEVHLLGRCLAFGGLALDCRKHGYLLAYHFWSDFHLPPAYKVCASDA